MARKKVTFDPDYQRKQKKVGSWVLSEAAGREVIRRLNMVNSAMEWIKAHPKDKEAEQLLYLYPQHAGCAWPIITIEQFLELPETVLNELNAAAQELNPHWFVLPDDKSQEKKTEELPLTSSDDLQT